MKKEPTKSIEYKGKPPFYGVKKEKSIFPFIVVTLLLGLIAGQLVDCYWMATAWKDISETNRLLATFQRIDMVKDEPIQCNDGAMLVDGHCMETVEALGKAKEKYEVCKGDHFADIHCKYITKDDQNDPNLCKQWKTICKDGPIGPQCDVKCTLDNE